MASHQDRALDDLRNAVHEYARILRRRWRLALLGVSLVGSSAFWVSQYLPRQYRTSTVFERRDDAVLRNLVHSKSPYSFDQLKSSVKRDMTGSRALAEAAVATGLLPSGAITSDQALTNDERRRVDEALAKYDLDASLRVTQSSAGLDTFELTCTANDPGIAHRFVIALRDGYIEKTRERMTEILSSARDFFATEVNNYQQQVNAANQKLKEQFAEFPGVDPSDPASAGIRLENLQAEHLRLSQRTAELEAQVSARERFLTSAAMNIPLETSSERAAAPSAPPVLPNTNTAIERAIEDVERKLADAIVLDRMTNEHPTVKALQRKLDTLHAARDASLLQAAAANAQADDATPADVQQRVRAVDPVLAGQRLRVELELDALRSQLEIATANQRDSEARLARFETLYDRLLEASDGMTQLEDQLQHNVATAAVWRDNLAQLERILAAESEQRGTQFSLIEEPKVNARAVKPQIAAIFIVCLGCGLAAAALLVALAELVDRSFRSAAQVTRTLGLPILECIGVINTPRVRRRQLVRRLVWTPALFVLVGFLLMTASLAYASLERPDMHQRAIAKLDNVLETVGAPPTSLGHEHEE